MNEALVKFAACWQAFAERTRNMAALIGVDEVVLARLERRGRIVYALALAADRFCAVSASFPLPI